jgi:hypothetical protein
MMVGLLGSVRSVKNIGDETMRTRRLVSYGVVAVLLAGCVPIVSLHPLFTKETVTFEEKLLGTWIESSEKPEVTWEFARLEESAAERLPAELRDQASQCYRVNVTDDRGRQGSLVACLVKLQDRLFLDVLSDKFPSGEQDPESMKLAYNAFFFLRVHSFARVDALGEQLKIRLTDDEGFKKLLAAEPKAVKYDTIDDHPVLTASTGELQAFLTKYAGDERLFPNDLTLTRKSK